MRTLMIWISLEVLLGACGNSERKVQEPPAPTEPAASGSANGSSQSSAEEQLFSDAMELTEGMATMVLADSGDCDALADQLVTLQPLATSIFSRAKELHAAATPTDQQRLAERFKGVKPAFEKADKQRADALNQKTSELATRCAGNQKLEQALGGLGLRMWKPS